MVGNAEAMFLGERIREVGLLRAAGATRVQVLLLFLRQGLAMGLIGSFAGVALGTLIAALMIGFLHSTRAALTAGLPLSPATLGVPFVIGMAVSASAAAIPSFAAARVSALDALRPSRQPGRSLAHRLPWLLGLVLLAVLGQPGYSQKVMLTGGYLFLGQRSFPGAPALGLHTLFPIGQHLAGGSDGHRCLCTTARHARYL